MHMTNRKKIFRVASALAVCGALAGLAATPARALDDDGSQSLFKTFTGIVTTTIGIPGLTPDDKPPAINYRERAPLVLPKQNSLRAPMPPVSRRNAAWPKDYDKERARRASSRPNGVIRLDDAGNEVLSARYLRDTGRLKRQPARDPAEECGDAGDPLVQPCNVPKMWRDLRNARKKEGTKDLIPGQEPPRTALTDPPPGLRTPSKRVKYTFEPAKDTPEVPDPRQAIREEAARDAEYR